MDFFNITNEVINDVRKFYNVTPESIQRDLDILKQWVDKEPHLPEYAKDDAFLERLLLNNKFRIEETKKKIDSYFTLRTLMKDFYEGWDEINVQQLAAVWTPICKILPDSRRLVIYRLRHSDAKSFDIMQITKACIMIQELAMRYDYNVGYVVVSDNKHFGLAHVKQMDINNFVRACKVYTAVYSGRVSAIYNINGNSYFLPLLNMFKSFSGKIGEKIHLTKDIKEAFETVPKKYFLKEYGGQEGSHDENLANMDKLIKDNMDFLNFVRTQRTDESKRVGDIKHYINDIYGPDGTFKKINVD